MNSDSLLQLLQTSVRVALGATTSLIEVLQDPTQREANLAKLREEWDKLSEEWESKGASTEEEARLFVNNLLQQRGSASASSSGGTATVAEPTAPPDVQSELQELTNQIAGIRAELEKMRSQD